MGTALEVAVDVVGVVEGAVGGGRGALYQLVCHDCSPAGWNFDISYSPSITGILMSLPLPPHIKVNSQILFRPLSP